MNESLFFVVDGNISYLPGGFIVQGLKLNKETDSLYYYNVWSVSVAL